MWCWVFCFTSMALSKFTWQQPQDTSRLCTTIRRVNIRLYDYQKGHPQNQTSPGSNELNQHQRVNTLFGDLLVVHAGVWRIHIVNNPDEHLVSLLIAWTLQTRATITGSHPALRPPALPGVHRWSRRFSARIASRLGFAGKPVFKLWKQWWTFMVCSFIGWKWWFKTGCRGD